MNTRKRLLSFFLALLMLASLVALPVGAENEEIAEVIPAVQEEVAEESPQPAGEPTPEPVPEATPEPTAEPETEPAGEEEESVRFLDGYEWSSRRVSMPEEEEVASTNGRMLLMAAPLYSAADESSYSSVTEGYITSAKDQGSYPVCWSFSATAMAEASLLKKSISSVDSLDLSEHQLFYFMFAKDKYDPLGNATGDKNYPKDSKPYYSIGCNHFYTMWALAGWTNGTTEDVMPFSGIGKEYGNEYNYSYDIAHLQNVRILPFNKVEGSDHGDISHIKEALVEYGALSVSFVSATYWSEGNSYDANNRHTCYNEDHAAYYCGTGNFDACDPHRGGHAVTLVGWNDDFPADYFGAEGEQAPGNGAWLMKNSWGDDYGTDGDADFNDELNPQGYFWMSYYDKSMANYYGAAYVFDYESADTYDNNYQYDGSCGDYYQKLASGSSVAATYTVAAAKSETIKAVGFGIGSTSVEYSVQIYKLKSKDSKPTSDTKLLSSPVTGTTDYEGYYTIEIPENQQPVLNKGDIFSVVITLKRSGGLYVAVDTEYSTQSAEYVPDSSHDYTYTISGNTVTALKGSGSTVRLKVYTTNNNHIDVEPQNTDLYYNATGRDTVKLNADLSYFEGWNITWSSDNTAVATVNDGLVTAVAPGTAAIYVKAVREGEPEYVGVSYVTVKKATDELKLDKAAITMGANAESTLEMTVSEGADVDIRVNDTALNKSGTYTVSGLTITPDGNTYSVKVTNPTGFVGKEIKLTFEDTVTGKSAGCTVTVKTVSLDQPALSMQPGDEVTLAATVSPAGGELKWESSNGEVATVEDGKVTAVSEGAATITVSLKDYPAISASCNVSVKRTITGLACSDIGLAAGTSGTVNLVVTGRTNNYSISTSSSSSYVSVTKGSASYDSVNGITTIPYTVKAGSPSAAVTNATVTFTDTVTGINTKCNVTVGGSSGMTMSPAAMTLKAGDSQKATAKFLSSSRSNAKWSTSDSNVATVSSGTITARNPGICVITATYLSLFRCTCTVTVEPKTLNPAITMNPTTASVKVGSTVTLNATSDVTPISWKSSDNAIATVENGVVRGVKAGKVTITASNSQGGSATCEVTVNDLNPAITMNPTTASVKVGSTVTLNATSDVTPISWKSSDDTIATVESGVVRGVKAGKVTITASNSKGGSATCEVTVEDVATVTPDKVSFTSSTVKVTYLLTKSVKSMVKVTFSDGKSHSGDYTVKYSSSNTSIATVSSNGLIYGKKKGTCTVTASVTYGGVTKSGDIRVTVAGLFG